jgi:hypothetical protein
MDKLETRSNWYEGITKQIDLLKETLDRHNYRKYKIDILQCLVNRVEQFSSGCGQCQIFEEDMTKLVQDVSYLSQMPSKEVSKQYFKSMNSIIGHLQRQHKLVTEGYYVGIGMAIGAGIGVAIGTAMGNVGSGIPIGVGIGMALGVALDTKAKKEDKILCPRQERITAPSSRSLILIGILVALVAAGILAMILFSRSS